TTNGSDSSLSTPGATPPIQQPTPPPPQQWQHQQQHWMTTAAAMQYPGAAAMNMMMMQQQQMMMYPHQYVPYNQGPYHHPHFQYAPYHQQQQHQHKPPHERGSGEDVKTLWVGDLLHWMDETYLHTSVIVAGGHGANGSMANGSQADGESNNSTIFVGGLDPDVTDEDLRQPFTEFGEVVSVKIPVGKGCGFVQFANRKSADDAIQSLNGTVIGKNTVRLSWGRTPNKWRGDSGQQWNGGYSRGQGKSEKAKINEPKGIALKLPKPLPKLKVPKLPKVPKLKVKEPKVKAPDGPPVGSPDWPPVRSPDGPPFGLSDHCHCRGDSGQQWNGGYSRGYAKHHNSNTSYNTSISFCLYLFFLQYLQVPSSPERVKDGRMLLHLLSFPNI
ncbi:hypothetical protein HID58_043705, partial [Brassica napus]